MRKMQQIQTNQPLSAREIEVLKLVAQGYTDEEIADALTLSVASVRSHLMHVRKKLGYPKCSHKEAGAVRVQLALYALKTGLVKVEGVPDSVYESGLQQIRSSIDDLINTKKE